MKKILYLCTGNLNRSYAAHAIAQERLPSSYEIDSAGTGKTAGGKSPNKRMRDALLRKGYAVPLRKSKKLTEELVDWADVIVCMGQIHYERVMFEFGFNASMKCVIFLENDDVPDPHFSKDDAYFDHVVQLIEDNIKEL
jgi:protein-tyrosine phosphatase